jgi:hypothetical protein
MPAIEGKPDSRRERLTTPPLTSPAQHREPGTEAAAATATADNVNARIEHDNPEMVARRRERRGAAPSVGGRVVNFMRGNNILVGVPAADGVNFEPDDFFC